MIFKNTCVCVCVPACTLSHSVVSDSLGRLWTIVCQAPLSMGFCRWEYWSGLPFLPPGGILDLPHPGMELASPAVDRWILYHWPIREAVKSTCYQGQNSISTVRFLLRIQEWDWLKVLYANVSVLTLMTFTQEVKESGIRVAKKHEGFRTNKNLREKEKPKWERERNCQYELMESECISF